MRVLYLHGFASSAASTKAGFFAARLREHGVELETPDFNQPEFSTLTISRMVEQTIETIDRGAEEPIVLIGSSLGAFVAVQVALRCARGFNPGGTGTGRLKPVSTARPDFPARVSAGFTRPISRLVLLAPALDFSSRDEFQLGDRSLGEWERSGYTNVFHYGYGRMIPVGYNLYADACGYDCADAALSLPILIFQGRHDTVVSPAMVDAWAAARPNVELHLVNDDHQLGASLDLMWTRTREFLALPSATSSR